MTISELIATLETVRAEHGDLEVVTGDEYWHAPSPSVESDDWDFCPEGMTIPDVLVL